MEAWSAEIISVFFFFSYDWYIITLSIYNQSILFRSVDKFVLECPLSLEEIDIHNCITLFSFGRYIHVKFECTHLIILCSKIRNRIIRSSQFGSSNGYSSELPGHFLILDTQTLNFSSLQGRVCLQPQRWQVHFSYICSKIPSKDFRR